MVYIRKLEHSLKFSYFEHNLDQRRSKYRPNFVQNDLFGNSFTNHGNLELKLSQYLHCYGILHTIRTLFNIWIIFTVPEPQNGQTWVLFVENLPFWQYRHRSWSFWDETLSECAFPWYMLENSDINSDWAIKDKNLGQRRSIYVGNIRI